MRDLTIRAEAVTAILHSKMTRERNESPNTYSITGDGSYALSQIRICQSCCGGITAKSKGIREKSRLNIPQRSSELCYEFLRCCGESPLGVGCRRLICNLQGETGGKAETGRVEACRRRARMLLWLRPACPTAMDWACWAAACIRLWGKPAAANPCCWPGCGLPAARPCCTWANEFAAKNGS